MQRKEQIDRDYYDWTSILAALTVEQLDAAWQRPVRHNQKIERAALWYALKLDEQCERGLSEGLSVADSAENAAVSYELHAGFRVVTGGLPLSAAERARLSSTDMRDEWEFEKEAIVDSAPDAFASWHKWLWSPSDDRGERPSVMASVFAEGCRRIATSAGAIVASAS